MPSIAFSGAGNSGLATLAGDHGTDQFVVRLKSGDNTTIQFSDNNGVSFTDATLSGITGVVVNGGQGLDTLVLDQSNGLVGANSGLPVTFNGGSGKDILVVLGNPSDMVSETFTPATSSTLDRIDIKGSTASATVSLSGVSQIVDTMNADTLTYNGDDNSNMIHLRQASDANGLTTNVLDGTDDQVLVADGSNNGHGHSGNHGTSGNHGNSGGQGAGSDESSGHPFPSLEFANKTNLVINGLGGDDLIVLTVNHPATGLKTLTVDGGTGMNKLAGRAVPAAVTLTVTNIQKQDHDDGSIFIDEMYQSQLQRNASADEVTAWMSILNSPAGQYGVVRGIGESPEARDNVVKGLYERYLNRPAQGGEEQAFVNGMLHGATVEQIIAGIMASPEFFNNAQNLGNTGTPNQQFVQALYQTLLNRSGSPDEVAVWANNVLPAAGPNPVIQGFLQSKEFRTAAITALYNDFLHRAPDQGGLDFWASAPMSLGQVREAFQNSQEFFTNG